MFKIKKADNEYGIDPYYLLYLLSHPLTKKQFFNKIMIDTTLPNIGDRWKELLLPMTRSVKKREEIKSKLKKIFEKKWKVNKELENIKKLYEE